MTVSAAVRFKPLPPALSEIKKTGGPVSRHRLRRGPARFGRGAADG
jgi:hypothetical protein